MTVDSHDPITSAKQNILVKSTPYFYSQPWVKIEYFEPMRLSAFPEKLTQDVLMAPMSSEYPAFADEVNKPSSPVNPHGLLVKNANLLLECFFHFEGLHSKIGRDLVLYTVGKACELSSEGARTLQRHVGCTLDTLREGRMDFLRRTKGTFIPSSEDHNIGELARRVDRYIDLKSEEPQEVDEKWYEDPAFENLWFEWQGILEHKGLRTTEGHKEIGKSNKMDRKGH